VRRRVLCVFPRYAPSFGTLEHAYALCGRTRAFMPPQGILVVAATMPADWQVRFIDENISAARPADFAWADAVFVSGMHVQRPTIEDINRRAHHYGKTTVLGGPSVSACPEYYREFDYLHIGELGDATQELFRRLDADPSRPTQQQRYQTVERTPLADFPLPAYHLAPIERYFLGSVQFSSGCPYRCEFCDIPVLYGRVPRLKSPQQVTRELDTLLEAGVLGAVYFVDDNFIGNRKATRELLPALIEWQRRRGYPLELSCEATLNIAKYPELLAMMREAYFTTVFCGIETPELDALRAMDKGHNASVPMYEAVARLNSYGLEVVSGIILGLDTDTADTPAHIREFVERSNIPMLTVNLLQALPRTPLYERLATAGRIIEQRDRESNVAFLQPYERVLAGWKRLIQEIYQPEAIYARYAYNIEHTYPRRLPRQRSFREVKASDLRLGLRTLTNLTLQVGLLSDYRRTFWHTIWPLLRAGRIADAIHVGAVAHHLITFTREAVRGRHNASFYSPHPTTARSATVS
jgi:hopanoid C-2 methylase